MLPVIEHLLVLQDRDLQIRNLRHALGSIPAERKGLQAQIVKLAESLEASKAGFKANEVERNRLELEVKGKREMIAKFKTQQQQTRKNEEFSALANEIAHCEKAISEMDDRQIELMEVAETLQREIQRASEEQTEAEALVKKKISELDAKEKNLSQRLAEFEADRATLASAVDPALLSRYERISAKKSNAIVPLSHGVCGGCHMKVSSSRQLEVKAEKEIVLCDQCGRILYSDE